MNSQGPSIDRCLMNGGCHDLAGPRNFIPTTWGANLTDFPMANDSLRRFGWRVVFSSMDFQIVYTSTYINAWGRYFIFHFQSGTPTFNPNCNVNHVDILGPAYAHAQTIHDRIVLSSSKSTGAFLAILEWKQHLFQKFSLKSDGSHLIFFWPLYFRILN